MWLQRNQDKIGKNQDNTDGNWDDTIVQVGKAARGRHNPRSLPQSLTVLQKAQSHQVRSPVMIKSPVPPVLPVMKKRGLQVHPVHPVRNRSSQPVRMMPPLKVHLQRVTPQQPEELR